jgi:LacI family transcriptional regulator
VSATKRIGVMMDLDKPYKRHIVVYSGIQEYAKLHPDWEIIVDEWADHSLPAKPGRPVPYDGIIGRMSKLGGERAKRLDLPAVNVWLASPAKGLPRVLPDFEISGKLVAEHLLGRGFRYLAALSHVGDVGVRQQAEAMKAFAEKAGFDGWLGIESIVDPKSYSDWQQAVRLIERWMTTWKVPLGLLVVDPSWGRVIIEAAKRHGWRCPEQIAIVCLHNEEIHCGHPEPGLTAVEMPDEKRGYKAAEMLDALIDAKRQGTSPYVDPQTVFMPPVGLVVRHSTDFFAVDNPLVGQALRYIASHLHKPLSVATVAKTLGVARRTLDSWFQKSIGTTVADEISRLRLERVKRELLAGSDPISAIARRTGFRHIRTFNNQFKQDTGLSPGEFRSARGRQKLDE